MTRPPSTPPPPAGLVYADFEGDTYGPGWTATGTFAGTRPPAGTIGDQNAVTGYEGRQLVNTFIDHDNGTGHISSPEFTITKDYINFLVGGGNHPYPGTATNQPVAVNLIVDGTVVRTKTGRDAEALLWTNWDVSALKGKTARIDIVDENTGGWGHINADHFTLRRRARLPALDRDRGQPARRRPGRAHHHRPQQRDARLARLERLELAGKTARIQIVDRNTGGWGHILADNFTFADQAGAVAAGPRRAGSTTARTTTPPCPGTTRPAASGS